MRQTSLTADKQTRLGNTRLLDYGIQNEESDLRAHVCVLARRVYVYRTENGLEAIRYLPKERERIVKTGGIVTARGFAISVTKIPGLQSVSLDPEWFRAVDIQPTDTPTQKGDKAVSIVKRLLERGNFPLLPVSTNVITDKTLQIKGTDIEVVLNLTASIQVKCDYNGGVGGDGCTGNLFLQTAECNPHGYI